VLDDRYKTSEESLKQVIERRKVTMGNLTETQKRIEELNPLLLDIENKIAASTSQQDRTQLEGERSKLATEYNEKQAKEQELLAESQTLERYTSMFQTFVDSLNNQIAAQSTLINKLTIDTEQRIVLYKALEDSLKTAAQQDVAHKINTLGSQVDNTAEETMAGIGAASQKHIGSKQNESNHRPTRRVQRVLHPRALLDPRSLERRQRPRRIDRTSTRRTRHHHPATSIARCRGTLRDH